jgi:osmoprotectant transport system substrate-binding protein/osmoprotectant transport system permease protein
MQRIGAPVAVVAAVVYSLFPVVLNTYTGIMQVDPKLKDAARGMGMTGLQILWWVELPLALPVILAGVRTGAIYAIGLTTLAALVGAGGLGTYITAGMSRGDGGLILLGVVPILVIALLLFLGLSGLARLARARSDLGLRLGGGLLALLALYGVAVPLAEWAGTPAAASAPAESDAGSVAANPTLWQTWAGEDTFWQQAWIFLSLTLRGLGLALLLGIPLGILLTRRRRLAEPLISVLGLIQTVPSLALLGLCVSLSGLVVAGLVIPPLFGPRAALIATVVYSLFPVVLNTYTGIAQVDPKLKDAARGMGMTGGQVLRKLELPLALPVVMAGVRTAALFAIAMATIGAMVGAQGLGDYVLNGMETENTPLILLGVIPILLITLLVFWALGGLEWLARRRPALGQPLSLALILLTSGYALADPFFRQRADLLIGCKNFMENRLLAEMLKALLETHTDLSVELYPNLGSNFAYKSIRAGVLDLYPEYTGTLLTAKDALYVVAKMPPKDITPFVQREMQRRYGLELLEPFGLNNTYAVVVKASGGLKRIGDLPRDCRVGVPQEFLDRQDGWMGLRDAYNLQSVKTVQFDSNYLYLALREQAVEAVVGTATDWQIGFFNPKLTKLLDNLDYFPSYLAAPLVRQEVLEKYPQVRGIVNRLAGRIGDETMRELIFQVVVQKRRPADVAREFLREQGLIE